MGQEPFLDSAFNPVLLVLYNPHSKGVNSAQRFSPTRFIPNAAEEILSKLTSSKASGIKRYTLTLTPSLSQSERRHRMRTKNPVVAAILSFIFGPLGYLYLGWRYTIIAFVVFGIFVLVLTIIDFPIPGWMKFVTLAVLAWKAFTICSVRNRMIENEDNNIAILNTFPIAAMAMSDLLVGMAMGYAGAIGIYAAAILFLEGSPFRGLFALLIGTPVLVWIATIVFGFVAMGLDALFVRSAENFFRR
jgi:hypothetical protein